MRRLRQPALGLPGFGDGILPEFSGRHADKLDLLFEVAPALEHHDAVVKMHGKRGLGELRHRHLVTCVIGIQFIDQRFA